MDPQAGEPLFDLLGIAAEQADVYLAALELPGSTAAGIADQLRVSRSAVNRALDRLEDLGFVSLSAERPRRIHPTPPSVAVEALATRRPQELATARLLAGQLEQRTQNRDPGELLEVIRGREAAGLRYDQLEQGAREEVLIFDRPPYFTTDDTAAENTTERDSLARGVRWRAVYSGESLQVAGGIQHVRAMMAHGEEGRVFHNLPLKLEIIDGACAVVPLDLHRPERGGTLIVKAQPLLDAMTILFETIWARATPLRFDQSGRLLDAVPSLVDDALRSEMLTLLGAGLKDEAVARQLGLSLRTLERRIAAVMTEVDAQTRFQAGWLLGARSSREQGT